MHLLGMVDDDGLIKNMLSGGLTVVVMLIAVSARRKIVKAIRNSEEKK